MIYLLLAIAASCVAATVYKLAAERSIDGNHVTLINYIIAVIVAIVSTIRQGIWAQIPQIRQGQVLSIFTEKTVGNTLLYSLIFGALFGVVFLATFLVMKESIKQNGIAATTFFGKTSFTLVLIFSIVVWKEYPTLFQCIGILLTVLAIALFAGHFHKSEMASLSLLFLQILMGALCELSSKLYSVYCIDTYKPFLLMIIYTAALLGCILYILLQKSRQSLRLKPKEILYGTIMGATNIISTSLQLKCMQLLPTSIVLPVLAVGNLMLSVWIGMFIFHEKTSRKQWLATLLALGSLVFVNL